jgi:hypothetical protein
MFLYTNAAVPELAELSTTDPHNHNRLHSQHLRTAPHIQAAAAAAAQLFALVK